MNDFALDGDKSARLVFVNGQNGSGKSTLLMGIGHNLVFLNAFGLGFCEGGYGSCFDKVRFLGDITGSMGEGRSSFMENVRVIKKSVEEVEALCRGGGCGVIISDEFMGGKTVHKESVAIQYPYWKFLSGFDNLLSVVATHDIELFDIAREEKHTGFDYYTMEYNVGDGFTYRVKRGAIDKPASIYVLRDMGFPSKLLGESVALLSKDSSYRFRESFGGGSYGVDVNFFADVGVVVFFLLGFAVLGYRRRRGL